MTEWISNFLSGGLLLGIAVGVVHAQSTGTLTGSVVDPSDRAVPGARVLLRNLASLVEWRVSTNEEGAFEIPALPVGVYTTSLTIRANSPFLPWRRSWPAPRTSSA
jgi:carboxypeptidase family protein